MEITIQNEWNWKNNQFLNSRSHVDGNVIEKGGHE